MRQWPARRGPPPARRPACAGTLAPRRAQTDASARAAITTGIMVISDLPFANRDGSAVPLGRLRPGRLKSLPRAHVRRHRCAGPFPATARQAAPPGGVLAPPRRSLARAPLQPNVALQLPSAPNHRG